MENTEGFCDVFARWEIHPRTRLFKHIFTDLSERRLDDWRMMKLTDIDMESEVFLIRARGKLNESREVPFRENTREILENWLKYHTRVSPYLFPYNLGAFQQSHFSQMFKDCFGMTIIHWRKAGRRRRRGGSRYDPSR
jgi:integrase